ncbi:MAG: pitrilysin family protein [bacterium]
MRTYDMNTRDEKKSPGGPALTLMVLVLAAAMVLMAAAGASARLPKKLKFEPIEFKAPEVETFELSNGLRGYLIEDHTVPLVDMVVMYRVDFPAEELVGINELAGWALRNGGSAAYASDLIDEELEFVGASIEAEAGMYMGEISANFLTKDADEVLAMYADLIINPAFDQERIDHKKSTMVEEIRRKADDPRSLGRREFARLIYRGHPASWEPTVESVNSITREDVVEFHTDYVRPGNAVIGIAGDITRDEAVVRLEALLAGWQPGGRQVSFPEMTYELSPSVNYIYKDMNQAYIYAGHMSMNSANEDYAYATIMNYILGGGSFTSWITQRIRSDEGLAYSARSSYRDSPFGYGLFTGSCQTKSDAAMRALSLLIEQIEKMAAEGPSAEEVAEARESMINRQVFDYESPARVVRRLVRYDMSGLPLDTLERRFQRYQEATPEDIRRVAGKYLHPDGLTILVIGDKDRFGRPLSDFGPVNEIEIEEAQ